VPAYREGVRYVGWVLARSLVVAGAGSAVAWLVHQALLGAWGEDPGFALIVVRTTLATLAGGLVILAGAAALRITELRTIVETVVDLLRRRGRA
jgi:hypothetical protein